MGPCAPNLNAYAERWVQSVQQEYLNHFVVFGERHLRNLLGEYVAHYHGERPHQGLDKIPQAGAGPPETVPHQHGEVVCQERLGGPVKHRSRVA
jgi:putative transposase